LLTPWVGQRAYCQEAAPATYRTKNLDATLCNDAKLKEKNEKLKHEKVSKRVKKQFLK
jgi:hypothetical protein